MWRLGFLREDFVETRFSHRKICGDIVFSKKILWRQGFLIKKCGNKVFLQKYLWKPDFLREDTVEIRFSHIKLCGDSVFSQTTLCFFVEKLWRLIFLMKPLTRQTLRIQIVFFFSKKKTSRWQSCFRGFYWEVVFLLLIPEYF